MNHIVTRAAKSVKTYSERRAEMADDTRKRILEATVTILARGVTELSIPAVAREAGVSVPTVYRNFPDKKALVRATALHLRERQGHAVEPTSLDELFERTRFNFSRRAAADDRVRAALASSVMMNEKRDPEHIAARRNVIIGGVREHLAGRPAVERQRIIDMVSVLCSSATLRGFHDILGMEPAEAAETVIWTIQRLLGEV
jgi:AcrR family transcriptional regulator